MSEEREGTMHSGLWLSLDMTDPGEPIHGRLERSDGEIVPFSGWLGLVAAIEGSARRSRDTE